MRKHNSLRNLHAALLIVVNLGVCITSAPFEDKVRFVDYKPGSDGHEARQAKEFNSTTARARRSVLNVSDICAQSFEDQSEGEYANVIFVVDLTPSIRPVFETVRNGLIAVIDRFPETDELAIKLYVVQDSFSDPHQLAVGKSDVKAALYSINHTNEDSTSIGRALFLLQRESNHSNKSAYIVATDGMTMETVDVLNHRLEGYNNEFETLYPVGGPGQNNMAVLETLNMNRTTSLDFSGDDSIELDANEIALRICNETLAEEIFTEALDCEYDPLWCADLSPHCDLIEVQTACPVTCLGCTASTSTITTSTISTTTTVTSQTDTTVTTSSTTTEDLSPITSRFNIIFNGHRCNSSVITARAPIFQLWGGGHSLEVCAMACFNQESCSNAVLNRDGYCEMFTDCHDNFEEDGSTTLIRLTSPPTESTTLAPTRPPSYSTVTTTSTTSTSTSVSFFARGSVVPCTVVDPSWCVDIQHFCDSADVQTVCPETCGICDSSSNTTHVTGTSNPTAAPTRHPSGSPTIAPTTSSSITSVTTSSVSTTSTATTSSVSTTTSSSVTSVTTSSVSTTSTVTTSSVSTTTVITSTSATSITSTISSTTSATYISSTTSTSSGTSVISPTTRTSTALSSTKSTSTSITMTTRGTVAAFNSLAISDVTVNRTHTTVILSYSTMLDVHRAVIQVQLRIDTSQLINYPERLVVATIDENLSFSAGQLSFVLEADVEEIVHTGLSPVPLKIRSFICDREDIRWRNRVADDQYYLTYIRSTSSPSTYNSFTLASATRTPSHLPTVAPTLAPLPLPSTSLITDSTFMLSSTTRTPSHLPTVAPTLAPLSLPSSSWTTARSTTGIPTFSPTGLSPGISLSPTIAPHTTRTISLPPVSSFSEPTTSLTATSSRVISTSFRRTKPSLTTVTSELHVINTGSDASTTADTNYQSTIKPGTIGTTSASSDTPYSRSSCNGIADPRICIEQFTSTSCLSSSTVQVLCPILCGTCESTSNYSTDSTDIDISSAEDDSKSASTLASWRGVTVMVALGSIACLLLVLLLVVLYRIRRTRHQPWAKKNIYTHEDVVEILKDYHWNDDIPKVNKSNPLIAGFVEKGNHDDRKEEDSGSSLANSAPIYSYASQELRTVKEKDPVYWQASPKTKREAQPKKYDDLKVAVFNTVANTDAEGENVYDNQVSIHGQAVEPLYGLLDPTAYHSLRDFPPKSKSNHEYEPVGGLRSVPTYQNAAGEAVHESEPKQSFREV